MKITYDNGKEVDLKAVSPYMSVSGNVFIFTLTTAYSIEAVINMQKELAELLSPAKVLVYREDQVKDVQLVNTEQPEEPKQEPKKTTRAKAKPKKSTKK